MGGVLLIPRTPELGKPDEVYATSTSRKDGVVLVYTEGSPVDDPRNRLVLTEVPGDIESVYLVGRTAVKPRLDRVSVNGRPGYRGSARRPPSHVGQPRPGQVLLWKQSGIALRLETNLSKERALRIAESVR